MNTESHDMPQWILIYTKPHQEKRAKENLENQGNEVFLPMIASEKAEAPNSLSIKPMFPRYLFCKLRKEEQNWIYIQSTRGVNNIVMFGKNLAKVPDSLIEYLKSKVDNNNTLKIQTIKKEFEKGEKILIKKGAFQGKHAIFLSMGSKERVRVLLSLMSRIMITDISEQDIEQKEIAETFKL